MVNNAAAAIIRQMIITLFERVSDEQEALTKVTVDPQTQPRSHTSDALNILSDICVRLNSNAPADSNACLDLSKIDRPFALDLIESIMSNHGGVFRAEPAFASVIKKHLCPLIIECFHEGDKRGDFARTCRLWRLSRLIICDFSDLLSESVQQFISFWPLILADTNSAAWEKAVVLEIFKTVMCSSLLLESIYSVCHEQPINEVLDAALQLMSAILSAFPNEGLITDRKNPVLNQFDKSTPPPVTQNYLLLLGYEAFTGWASNLVATVRGLAVKPSSNHFFAPVSQFEASRDRDMQMAAQLLSFVGPRLTAILLHLRVYSGEAIARLLTLFAVFELKGELDILLKTLLPFTLPDALAADPFKFKAPSLHGGNDLLMQMLLECAQDLAELLQDSWIWVVRLELGLMQMQSLREQKLLSAQLPFDLDRLLEVDKSLLERSESFTEACFTCFVQAHCKLMEEGLSRGTAASGTIMLLLRRLQQIMVASFQKRIVESEETSVAWDCLTTTLISAGKSRDLAIRLFATEILSESVVKELVKYSQPSKFKTNKALQLRVLKPISRLCAASGWPDLIKGLLDALSALIGALGESLSEEGYACVFEVCQNALVIAKSLNEQKQQQEDVVWDDSDELVKECGGLGAAAVALYRPVHDLIKVISADYLACLSLSTIDGLTDLVSELGRIKLAADEVNIPLNAVRYLWDISDHLAGLKSAYAFPCWLRVLKHLAALGLDARPELRNSAVQTMLRTVNMNGAVFKTHWPEVLDNLLLTFLRDLKTKSAMVSSEQAPSSPGFAHFTRDSAAKQWNETESASLNGFTQLLQTHQQSFLQLPEWKRYWCETLAVYQSYVIESKAEELISVTVSSLLSLATAFSSEEACHEEIFSSWSAITAEMKRNSEIPFCQDSLIKMAKIPLQVSRYVVQFPSAVQSTLDGISTVLQYATPNDPVRDTDGPSELQRFCCSALLDDLAKICDPSLLIEEVSKWIVLARGSSLRTFAFGFPSLRSRQSTASSSKSSHAATPTATSPTVLEYSYIGMVGMLIPRSVKLLNPEITNNRAIESLLHAYGKYMQAKFKSPGSLDPPLWQAATEAFQSAVKLLSLPQKKAIWPVILSEMRAALLACKSMFAPASEWAEEIDCGWFDFMRNAILPDMESGGVGMFTDDIVTLLIEIGRITQFDPTKEEMGGIVRFSSWNRNSSADSAVCDFKFPSGIGPLPIVVKERLCFAAYELVIQLALNGSTKALTQISALSLLHLKAFIADRRVLGPRFPLSRLRILELSALLTGCLRVPGVEHLKGELGELVIIAEGNPKSILKLCQRILKRLNGLPDDPADADAEPSQLPVKRPQPPPPVDDFFPSRPNSPIILPAEQPPPPAAGHESRPLSPNARRSFSEALIHNFRSMELFDSGE